MKVARQTDLEDTVTQRLIRSGVERWLKVCRTQRDLQVHTQYRRFVEPCTVRLPGLILHIARAPESVDIPGAVVASSRTNNLGVPVPIQPTMSLKPASTCCHNESGGPAVLFNKLSVLSRSGNHISCPSLAVADRMRSSFTLRPSATERAESATGTYTVSAW